MIGRVRDLTRNFRFAVPSISQKERWDQNIPEAIRDTYNAEKQFFNTMPKLSKTAANADLKKRLS
ncbi:hypothetical protein BH11ARM1_BH11ARM1_04100 [soil metagenome]